jgi:hypothetical protein
MHLAAFVGPTVFYRKVSSSCVLKDTVRNYLLGPVNIWFVSRRSVAKFLMMTFTCRSPSHLFCVANSFQGNPGHWAKKSAVEKEFGPW